MLVIPWWLPTLVAVLCLLVGFILQVVAGRLRGEAAARKAGQLVKEARLEARNIVQAAKLEAEEEYRKRLGELEKEREKLAQEAAAQREDLKVREERVATRELNLDRKLALLERKEEKLEQGLAEVEQRRKDLEEKERELESLIRAEQEQLQKVSGWSREEARREFMRRLQEELKAESGALIKRMQEEARETAERRAREIITDAIVRYAGDQVNQVTTSTVALPSDEMKGRIIGKEGRNIRAFQAATGVDVLIDDTPEVVVLSCFDPVRREIARVALERLVADGRIQPASIEEAVKRAQEEMEARIREAGEQAVMDAGIRGVPPQVVAMLGRLKYRYSYGQNVLRHSVEMAHIMGMMAAELGLDPAVARRVGLFHDIGKALDHEHEGGHAVIGADFLRRQGESPLVYNAVAAHHGQVTAESPYAALAVAADAITAGRPGARVENTEQYLKRMEKLEQIAARFRGVNKCYAIQAGREIRVFVEPSKIDDNEAMQLARNISRMIEEEMEYPGQIKVTVIRETRCVEYAH